MASRSVTPKKSVKELAEFIYQVDQDLKDKLIKPIRQVGVPDSCRNWTPHFLRIMRLAENQLPLLQDLRG